MDASVREEAISLKIKLLREKNQMLEKRHKMVEEDKRKAVAVGRSVDSVQSITNYKPQKKPKDDRYSHHAHMDGSYDADQGGYEQAPRRPRPKQHDNRESYERRQHNEGLQQYGGRVQHDDRHERDSKEFEGRRPQFNKAEHDNRQGYDVRHGQPDQRNPDRQSDYSSGYHKKTAERERQRRSNIDKMEAQMSGQLQKGDQDWQEPVGYLHDPKRQGEGEYTRRPPPKNYQYNPAHDQPRQRSRDGPMSKLEMSVEMTGRQRRDYEQWKSQQDAADKLRLARAQAETGHWKREWDNEKHEESKEEDRNWSSGGGYNQKSRNHQRRTPRSGFHGNQSRRTYNNDEPWEERGENNDWPLLDDTETRHQPQRQQRKQNRRSSHKELHESRKPQYENAEESNDSKPQQSPEKENNVSERNPHVENEMSPAPSGSSNQFSGHGKSRGRGRGRGRGRDQKVGHERKPRGTSKNQGSLKVEISPHSPEPTTTEGASTVEKTPPDTGAVFSPLKTPDNFVKVDDWATEVEMCSPSYKKEESFKNPSSFESDETTGLASTARSDEVDKNLADFPVAVETDTRELAVIDAEEVSGTGANVSLLEVMDDSNDVHEVATCGKQKINIPATDDVGSTFMPENTYAGEKTNTEDVEFPKDDVISKMKDEKLNSDNTSAERKSVEPDALELLKTTEIINKISEDQDANQENEEIQVEAQEIDREEVDIQVKENNTQDSLDDDAEFASVKSDEGDEFDDAPETQGPEKRITMEEGCNQECDIVEENATESMKSQSENITKAEIITPEEQEIQTGENNEVENNSARAGVELQNEDANVAEEDNAPKEESADNAPNGSTALGPECASLIGSFQPRSNAHEELVGRLTQQTVIKMYKSEQ